MQRLPDGWIFCVLLEVDYLLEVHLRVVRLFCVNTKRLLIVAYALLDLLATIVFISEGKDRMRT